MTTDRPAHHGSNEPATVRVAMWSARHRWLVVTLWFVATIGIFAFSLSRGGINAADANAGPNDRQLEATKADDVFNAGGTNDPYEQFLVVIGGAPGATVTRRSRRQSATSSRSSTRRVSTSTVSGRRPSTSWSTRSRRRREAGLVSADGSTVRIVARVPGDKDRVAALLAPILPIIDEARAANPAAHPRRQQHLHQRRHHDADQRRPRSVAAAHDPADVPHPARSRSAPSSPRSSRWSSRSRSLLAAFGILGSTARSIGPVSPNATQLIVLIGLAVAVDYSLFMITRFRIERRAGRPRDKAIEVSSSTAGRAVFFSGLAVMISLAGLLTLGVTLFTSMAVGTIAVVLVSVVGSLTFLPAMPRDHGRPGECRAAGHLGPAAPRRAEPGAHPGGSTSGAAPARRARASGRDSSRPSWRRPVLMTIRRARADPPRRCPSSTFERAPPTSTGSPIDRRRRRDQPAQRQVAAGTTCTLDVVVTDAIGRMCRQRSSS